VTKLALGTGATAAGAEAQTKEIPVGHQGHHAYQSKQKMLWKTYAQLVKQQKG